MTSRLAVGIAVGSVSMCVVLGVGACSARGPATRPAEGREAVVVPMRQPSRTIAQLEAMLGSENPEERAAAAWELAGAAEGSAALLDRLRVMTRSDGSERSRQATAWAYSHLEPVAHIKGATRAYDEAPVPVETSRPSPPTDPAAHRAGGDVLVEVLISETGEVVHAEVRQSVVGLDQPALDCAKPWRFTPARAEGKAVASVARVSVSFRAYR